MKKIAIVVVGIMMTCNFIACKSEKKSESQKEVEVKKTMNTSKFLLKKATNKIAFTAYKTTDKVGVSGQFKKVDITAGGSGNTIKEAINNTEFSIPVSSIFTKDSSRDFKITKFFFGAMENTKMLTGKLILENDSIGKASIKMNGISSNIPFSYTITENTFSMNGTLDISDWKALNALESLNKACFDLHKGADGVSKTWREVSLNIVSTF